MPTPALKESEMVPPHLGNYQVIEVVGHRRGQGRHSPHNYIYRLRLKSFGPEVDTELTRSHNVKNSSQHTALNINSRQSRLLLAINASILLRKTVIPSVAIPHRTTVVPSKANPLFASVLAIISGSTLLRKTVVPSKTNPLFASTNPNLARIKRK